MHQPGTQVRLLLMNGTISTDTYIVEEDKNAGDVRLIRESTMKQIADPDTGATVTKGQRVIVNAQRVFPSNIIDYAVVINTSTGDAVACCPVCGSSAHVSHTDTTYTCSKHGTYSLYRTSDQAHKLPKPVTQAPVAKETKVKTQQASPPTAEPAATVTAPSIDTIAKLGELWVKERVEFNYQDIDVRAYAIFVTIDGTLYKHCFNTYNGSAGKKGTDILAILQGTKNAYKVSNLEKARSALKEKGYKPVTQPE